MTAILKVDTIQDTSGNNIINENANTITIGKSGDTVNLASGATAGFGKVLQVLTATDTTERTTTSSTFVTGSNTMLINITPSSTSSKIFLISTFSGRVQGGGAMYTIYRDSTNIGATNGITRVYNAGDLYFNISMSILDAPSSTSQIAYQVYFNCQNGGTATVNSGNLKASLTAFEVGA